LLPWLNSTNNKGNSEILGNEEQHQQEVTIQVDNSKDQTVEQNTECSEEINLHTDETISYSNKSYTNQENASDPGLWPYYMNSALRLVIVKAGPIQIFQNTFPKNNEGRSFSTSYYNKNMPNGEKVHRSWLVYSNVKDSVYCFCCILFSENRNQSTRFLNGYNNWRKLTDIIKGHEVSSCHIKSFIDWQELLKRLHLNSTIDSEFQTNINNEIERLKLIFRRIADVILFLSKNNLSLRGTNEKLGVLNNGNFLSLIELLGKYDPVLIDYLNRIKNTNRIIVHHLAHKSQEEFITALGNEVLNKIIEDINYSIQMD